MVRLALILAGLVLSYPVLADGCPEGYRDNPDQSPRKIVIVKDANGQTHREVQPPPCVKK